VASDESYGRALASNGHAGTVSMLDIRRRVVLKTIAVGAHPAPLAVDRRYGRLVCIGLGAVAAWVAPLPTAASVSHPSRP